MGTIYTPQFTLTPRLLSGIAAIERTAWLIEHMLLMPKHEAWIQREVAVKRAAGTTAIEGVGLPEREVAALQAKGAGIGETEAEQANINALRAYGFIDYLSSQNDVPIDELAIREMNRQFLLRAADVLTPGAYRRGQNTINDFMPPNQGDVPSLMRGFGLWLREPDNSVNPVILAGLAHLHLVAVHPFWDGNGRTARGLAALIIQRSPISCKNLLSLDSVFAANRDGYVAAIEQTLGSTFSNTYDATPWLEFFVHGVETATDLLEHELIDWHRTMAKFQAQVRNLGLKQRQIDALAFASRSRTLTRREYMEITAVKELTATRDLADLVQRRLLVAQGRTRDRTYTWNAG
jgi:Fic family protein